MSAGTTNGHVPLLRAQGICKSFGPVQALRDVSITVDRGGVTCLLGDNGAGKSTLIKTLSGVTRPTRGELLLDGEPVSFRSPRDASAAGIATVYQDLGLVPIMSVYRNFVLGHEPLRGRGPFRRLDVAAAKHAAVEELAKIGIGIRDLNRPVVTMSGGERQCVAIARAAHFGAKVLILDEPTSALGVKEAAKVLKYVVEARKRGVGVVFITHNVAHALPVGDRFVVLNHGAVEATFKRGEVGRDELLTHMAGGAELAEFEAELEQLGLSDGEPPA
ncbi:MAG TPA: ATP-binding cassette domain-containing protein [Conexibacter sp.]|nr:ATP-binding cassette domain-containing protein [Conexibacter sp.]